MSAIRDTKHAQAAGIAGFAFMACIAMAAFTWMFSHLREMGPVIRAAIHWLLESPQTWIGLVGGMGLTCIVFLVMAWESDR